MRKIVTVTVTASVDDDVDFNEDPPAEGVFADISSYEVVVRKEDTECDDEIALSIAVVGLRHAAQKIGTDLLSHLKEKAEEYGLSATDLDEFEGYLR